MATAGSIVIDLLMRTGSFVTDLARNEKRLQQFGKTAKQVGTVIGAGLAAGTAALASLTLQAIETMDQLDEMSARVGISTETLSKWGYAAKLSGTDLEGLGRGIGLLSKNMAAALDSDSSMGKLFESLGVQVTDATGKLRDVEEVLPEIADRFAALDDQTLETALSMQLFGKSGSELLEFLNRGSQGIDTLGQELESLGGVISSEAAAGAAMFKDELDKVKVATEGLGVLIASQLAPALGETAKEFRLLVTNGELASNIVTVLEGAMSAGVGVINLYNQAVENTAIGMEMLMKYALGTIQIFRNLASLGIADGSVVGGLKAQLDAVRGGFAAREEAIKRRNMKPAGPGVIWADSGAEPAGLFAKSAEQLALEKQAAEMEGRLQKYFAGSDSPKGGGAKKRAKEEKDVLDIMKEIAAHNEVVADVQADLAREAERRQEAYDRVNDDILAQIDLLGMTQAEQEAYNALAWAGVDATSEQGKQLLGNLEKMQQVRDVMEDQITAIDSVRDAGHDFLLDLTTQSKSFKDAALDAFDSIHQRILSMISENLMDQLFGKQGDPAGGSTAGWFSTILGAMFGGAKAGGGDVFGGRAYLVGEEGPEAFIPRGAGTIVPAGETAAMLSGRGGLNQTIHFNTPGRVDRRTRQQVAADMAVASQSALSRNGKGGR